eukprot:TRINITY_DN1775_c1_g3_i2.p1 TRINITY_DN1775_c1_g3~~TRINITY_DN1775_c1_g3_i2.p1  ORF type:complete len:193 (-),score=16.04 TRINITY_DN1775_c1_g3_i2:205-783(-)
MGRRATNADDKGKGKASIRCFKCNEYGHISSECLKKGIHVAEREEESNTPSYVADDDRPKFDNSESDNDIIYGDGGQFLMIHKTLFSPKIPTKEDWLRTSIFRTTCTIKDRKCHLIVDGGSCENVVSQEVVDKLKLPTKKHPAPYNLSWFKCGNEVPVTREALVSFSIGGRYHEAVWCVVAPMDVSYSYIIR